MLNIYNLAINKVSVVAAICFASLFLGFGASAQQFTAGRLVVERVGNGSAQSDAGTDVYLDEYSTTGVPGISLAMPTTTVPPVNRTVESGIAASSGMLSRSMDGAYLVISGYDAAVGTPLVASSSSDKVVTRIDPNGNLASTVVTNASAFPANSFRSVATVDGSEYWLSGSGNGAIHVMHQGSTTAVAGTEVSNTITDNRSILIYNSQLFQSTGVPPNTGVYNVGTGLPVSSGNTMAIDANSGATGDPNAFVIIKNGTIPVMYVADFSNKLIRKYFQFGSAWSAAGSVSVTVGGVATGFYGITGNVAGGAVHLYATTCNGIGSNSRIVTFVDATTGSTVITGTTVGTTIVGPTTNTAIRGITFVPYSVTSITTGVPSMCTGGNTTVTITGNPGTVVTYQVNGINQLPITIPIGGSYSFSTGTLTTTTTYAVVSATDGTMTQVYGYSATVVVNPLPSVTATAGAPVCPGFPLALNASGAVSYTWTPGTSLSATTGAVITTTVPVTTNYTVTGTDINGCVKSTVVTATIKAAPSISTGTPVAICNGSSAALAVSGGSVSYVWAPATGLSSTTAAFVTASPTTTTSYTITGTGLNGCTSSIVNTVTVNPLPVVTASPDVDLCTGSSAVLSASGAATYIWLPATGLSAMAGASVTATPLSTTTYTVTGTDVNGCKSTAQVTVTIHPFPAVSAGANVSLCIGSSTTLNATGAATYTWTPGTGLSTTTGSSVVANPTTTTTYSITGTDIYGCYNFATVTVTVNPLPIISTSTPVAICNGSSTTLSASGGLTYSWSPGFGLSATTGSSVIASPPITTTYLIVGTDSNGCSSSVMNTVTVNPLPTVSASPDVVVCRGTPTVLSATGTAYFDWFPGTGLSSTTGSSTTATPTSTTTYTVTGTDLNGCRNTASVTVSVNALPVVTAGPNLDICIGASTTLTASGAVSYTWSPALGLSDVVGATVTANPTTTTMYMVTGTDANGCINGATVTVNVHSLPVVSGTSAGICPGGSAALSGIGTTAYSWAPATGLSSTVGTVVIASPTSTTTYTITGTNTWGCSSTATVTVTVYPLPVVSAGPDVSICNGSSTVLTSSGGGTYTWSPGYGLSVTTGSTVTAHPATTTTYTITVINLCVNRGTITVSVNPLPTVVAPGTTICMGSPGGLTASGAATYTWSPATALSATTGSSVTTNPTANTIYTVTGTDGNGCVSKVPVPVYVNLLPTITAGLPATICNGSSTTLTASGGITYSWAPSAGLSVTTGSIVVANPSGTTVYTITGTSPYGCVNTTTKNVIVNPLPDIFDVTGGGTFCAGGVGVPVGLSGSQGGINYELYQGSLFYGTTRVGTGSALDFGHPGSAGYYTIIATDLATYCRDTMSGGAGITINHGPVALAVTGGGSYCPSGAGEHVGLIGSVTGVLYQLYRDTVAIDTPVAGTGTALDFGLHTAAGTYTATGINPGTTCVTNMTGSASISILPLPAVFSVTGGGDYCQGGTGVHIGLIGSQIGNYYQVYLGGSPMGTSLIGLNAPLDFGLFTTPGTYTVTGRSYAGCTDSMSGSATVVINPTPVITGTSMIAKGNTTTLNATPAGGTWTSSFPSVASIGASSGVVTGLVVGASDMTYTLPTGCSATYHVTITINVGVPGTTTLSDLTLAPNPNNGSFTLKGNIGDEAGNDAEINVVNAIGQVVYSKKAGVSNGELDEYISMQNAAAGMYILSVKTGTGNAVIRFVKE